MRSKLQIVWRVIELSNSFVPSNRTLIVSIISISVFSKLFIILTSCVMNVWKAAEWKESFINPSSIWFSIPCVCQPEREKNRQRWDDGYHEQQQQHRGCLLRREFQVAPSIRGGWKCERDHPFDDEADLCNRKEEQSAFKQRPAAITRIEHWVEYWNAN